MTKDEQQLKIVRAFHNLLLENGYESASIRKIAKKADVVVQTIYNLFPQGKKQIMEEFMVYFSNEILKVDLVMNSKDIQPDKILDYLVPLIIHESRKHITLIRAIYQAVLSNPELNFSIVRKEYFENMVSSIITRPEYKNYPKEIVITAFIFTSHTLNSYVFQHLLFDPFFKTDEELITFLLKLLKNFFETDFKILFN